MSLMTSGGVESFLYIGTARWYREVPIVSMPPTRQTLTAAARHDSSISYPSAEDVFCCIHSTDVHDDDFADLALSDSLDTFRLSSAHMLTRRADSDLFFTPYNRALVGCGLEPDLHRPGDGILNLSMGYVASIGVFAAENSAYHSHTVSLGLCL